MASLKTNEKLLLEKLFHMGSGYVLNFSDRTMGEFFRDDLKIDIYDERYNYASGSKANRMRGFWQAGSDAEVGTSIAGLIDYIENQVLLGNLPREEYPDQFVAEAKKISARLSGGMSTTSQLSEDEFISREFKNVSVEKVGLDRTLSAVLNQRIDEIRRCLGAGSPLAVIFLCGSTLEGLLLGVATANPMDFNRSALSPKDMSGKVKPFHEWTLSDFINVSRDLKLLGEDVKKFSHALRDFRNYIHPHQQVTSQFNPDQHTAKICWQVLQTAISQLER